MNAHLLKTSLVQMERNQFSSMMSIIAANIMLVTVSESVLNMIYDIQYVYLTCY